MISSQNMFRGSRSGRLGLGVRKGAVAVLSAILMIVMLAMVAFAIDIGYLVSAKTEMQRTADAAALAAAWEMYDDDVVKPYDETADYAVRTKAAEYAAKNEVIKTTPNLNLASDITVGYLENPADRTEQLSSVDPSKFNTVQVRVRYTDDQNQPIPFFFAPLLGMNSQGLEVKAAASFPLGKVIGFTASKGGGNSTIMPFAIKVGDWKGLVEEGQGTDDWSYDPETGTVSSGGDGIPEIRMFPQKDLGEGAEITPGNFGTVDVGSPDNSTSDLWRQILYGPNAQDFSYLENGTLRLDPVTGKLYLNGDTGISAAIGVHGLQYVVGKPRTIMLYESVQNPGNNAIFTVVGFAGVRVMTYSLTGNNAYILIQPSMVVDSGAVTGETDNSYFVGPPVRLVR